MTVLFREHRASLSDSMETVVEIESFAALQDYVLKNIPYIPQDGILVVQKYGIGIDERIEWDTHLVTWSGNAIGFTNGMLN